MSHRSLWYLACDSVTLCLRTSADLPGRLDAPTQGDAETIAYRHGWTEVVDDAGVVRHLCPAHSTHTERGA